MKSNKFEFEMQGQISNANYSRKKQVCILFINSEWELFGLGTERFSRSAGGLSEYKKGRRECIYQIPAQRLAPLLLALNQDEPSKC